MSDYYSLPLLRGWKYEYFDNTYIIEKNRQPKQIYSKNIVGWLESLTLLTDNTYIIEKNRQPKQIYSKNIVGWLESLTLLTDDLYTEFYIEYNDIRSKLHAQQLAQGGFVLPPPFGYFLNSYLRPSPLSTAGVFVIDYMMAHPFTLKGNVFLKLALPGDSTQESSTSIVQFSIIRIIDPKEFMASKKELGLT